MDARTVLPLYVIKSETEYSDLPNYKRHELCDLLRTLNSNERFAVAKYFCKLSWNVGCLKILSILQELRILTATEYILSCANFEEAQLILNDFLESRFELVMNLFINSTFDSSTSARLNALLQDCLQNLWKDLLINSELNNLDFLSYIHKSAPADIRIKIIHKVLSSILELRKSNVRETFRCFTSWINEGVNGLNLFKYLYKKFLNYSIEESLNVLLKYSTNDSFNEWKFYLIMLQTISRNNNEKAGPYIRKYLQLSLKKCAKIPSNRSIIHILLSARASTATTIDITENLNNYANWYKNHIGEMKFFLKDDEFRNVLELLNHCINYEMDTHYLEIHTVVFISPPVLCGNLIKAYKNKCKQRLQEIKKGNLQGGALTETIVVEGSN